jgi:hypothetical protein
VVLAKGSTVTAEYEVPVGGTVSTMFIMVLSRSRTP